MPTSTPLRPAVALLLAAAVSVAACSADDGEADDSTAATAATTSPAGAVDGTSTTVIDADDATDVATGRGTSAPPPEPDDVATSEPSLDPDEVETAAQIEEYVAEAAAFTPGEADAQFPEGLRFAAGGAPGYSRYVFREIDGGDVVPTLVEGPLGFQVRCQDPALPCSYLELKELHESGAPIPDELGLDPATLAELVAQLDALSEYALRFRDVDDACAEGYVSDRIQTPNMGSHLYKPQYIADGFVADRPEILLYVEASGQLPDGPVGQCVGGTWQGEPMTLVGTAFLVAPDGRSGDHPAAFAGELDNWHIHYNLCRGASEGRDSFGTAEQCAARGGAFSQALGWMIHAWVDPEHDNQLGVFSMWNSTLPPLADAGEILDAREVRGSDAPDGAVQSLVTNFAFDSVIEVAPGQAIWFNNVDSVPHTVSAGSFDDPDLERFDSGLLSPGNNYELRLDEPGTYQLFCALHPDMTASVVVSE